MTAPSPSPELTVVFHVRPDCLDLAVPSYATPGAAGADLRAAVEEPLVLESLERAAIATGLRLEIPPGFEGQVRARSGLARAKGLSLVNGVGTIDSDYRGEVSVLVINLGKEPVTILRGDRIAQVVFASVARAAFERREEISSSLRGEGGFGSTGSR